MAYNYFHYLHSYSLVGLSTLFLLFYKLSGCSELSSRQSLISLREDKICDYYFSLKNIDFSVLSMFIGRLQATFASLIFIKWSYCSSFDNTISMTIFINFLT